MIERSLVLVKPDGVARGLTGKIIQRIEDAGMKIVAMKMIKMDIDFAKKHYKAHIAKPFYTPLEKFMTSGPVVAMVVEGVDAVENIRKMTGATEPKSAAPGTIRGDYAHVSYEHADKKSAAIQNIIHASGDKIDAEYEIPLWFDKKEIMEYQTVYEKYTL